MAVMFFLCGRIHLYDGPSFSHPRSPNRILLSTCPAAVKPATGGLIGSYAESLDEELM